MPHGILKYGFPPYDGFLERVEAKARLYHPALQSVDPASAPTTDSTPAAPLPPGAAGDLLHIPDFLRRTKRAG